MKAIKILRFADDCIGMFDTTMMSHDPSRQGRRVKHYVRKEGFSYIHTMHWLEPAFLSQPTFISGVLYISERVFFGKYRVAEKIDGYQDETWHSIAAAAQEIERCMKECNR